MISYYESFKTKIYQRNAKNSIKEFNVCGNELEVYYIYDYFEVIPLLPEELSDVPSFERELKNKGIMINAFPKIEPVKNFAKHLILKDKNNWYFVSKDIKKDLNEHSFQRLIRNSHKTSKGYIINKNLFQNFYNKNIPYVNREIEHRIVQISDF